uniref:Uncharacterized protein n=1 Tax=Timema cristinae TaxID=61476 RepID=A0A7R9H455_TIMCR|nr:unnamed protein product [Timema cristinae]
MFPLQIHFGHFTGLEVIILPCCLHARLLTSEVLVELAQSLLQKLRPNSRVAIALNEALNKVTVDISSGNLIRKTQLKWDCVLIGDMFYNENSLVMVTDTCPRRCASVSGGPREDTVATINVQQFRHLCRTIHTTGQHLLGEQWVHRHICLAVVKLSCWL